ncbi:MAG TPA: hypothetical protein VHG30_12580 [Microvirga sp.]|nr:hypothetical protein [Microvirga sp.]
MTRQRFLGTRCWAAILIVAAVTGAVAQEDEDERRFEFPPPLPEGLNGVVRPGQGGRPDAIDRIRDVFRALQACWQPPRGSGYSGQELTIRLSFKRSGEVLGQPRITYYKSGGREDEREAFTRSVRSAFERCTPLPFTARFGAAVAGRPFTFRFIDSRPL